MEAMRVWEKRALARGYRRIAGVDEAGRGPLAGPIVAAACVLPENVRIEGINDSKQLSPSKRQAIFQQLIAQADIDYGIGIVDAVMIDQVNILQATFQAMLIAISRLSQAPDYLLVDGDRLPLSPIPGESIVDGDALSLSIAAASIIAKETRDALMHKYHEKWPEYGFDAHKGYGTKRHMQALQEHGPCPIHRMSFEPVKTQTACKDLGATRDKRYD